MKQKIRKTQTKIERFSLIDSIDKARFMVTHTREIVIMLNQIKKRGAFLTGYSFNSHHSFMTSILDIDEEKQRIIFDSPSEPLINRHFLNQGELILSTAIDRVRIQFELSSIRQSSFDSKPVYVASFPNQITRLQRRDF